MKQHFPLKLLRIILLSVCYLLTACTITTDPSSGTHSTTSSTAAPAPDPTDQIITPTNTVTVSDLTVDVTGDMATVRWHNPTSNYAYSELYLYRLTDTGSYEFAENYYLNKILNQYPLDRLAENATYNVQIASYTPTGAMDYVSTEFTTGKAAANSVRFSISYRAGFVYLSDMFGSLNAYILEVGSSGSFNDTNRLGETVRAGDTAKILVSDLPPDYTIDDVKWQVYWMDWQKNESDEGYEGDQYSENPVMTFEESTQTLTARRMGMGYVLAYIDNTKFSNVLYFDIRERIEKIQVLSPTYLLSLDESNDKLTKTTFKAFYYDNDDNRLALPFVKEAEWSSSDESVVTINPIIPTDKDGKPTAVNSTNWAEIIAAGNPGRATVTLIANGVRWEKEVTVVQTLTPQTTPDPTDPSSDPTDPSSDPTDPDPTPIPLPKPVVINSVTFNPTSVTIAAYTNEYTRLQYTIDPADASPDLITFTAYNVAQCTELAPGIVIQGDKIMSNKNGTSYIQASWYAGGQRHTSNVCTVTSETALGEVTFDDYEILLKPGDSFQLTPHYVPAYATIKSTSYTSDNANITVSNDGLITASQSAVNGETANITAKFNNDITGIIQIRISTPVERIDSSSGDLEFIVMNTGDTLQLSATAYPNVAPVTWSSKYPQDVTIDSTGRITALRAGGSTIFASAGQVTNIMKYILVIDKSRYEIINADQSLTGDYSDYVTSADGTMAFSKSKLDIAVKSQSGSWYSPTLRQGLKWKIGDTALTFSNGRAVANTLSLMVTPVLVKDKTTNKEKILFGQAILKDTNNTISTGVKFGSWLTLTNIDGSPLTLTKTETGVETIVSDTSFSLECKNAASTVYIGSSINTPNMIYSDSTAATFSAPNVGAAFSYYAGMMGPGSIKTASFTIEAAAVNTDGSVDVIAY
ncbi:MAG: Ig-like domain-containing protein [Spirochaetales bacterium]|nr:Ig-like domain-containing protein [Spirochaetales bacterium]